MKRLLMILGLVITLGNVTAGVVYACTCYENGSKACEATGHCYHDAGGRCHCVDASDGGGDGGGEEEEILN